MIASTGREADRLASLLESTEAAAVIRAADLKKNLLVAVFRGRVRNTSFRIAIADVELRGGGVRVLVDLIDPSPGRAVAPVASYPYHVVLVPRSVLALKRGMIWEVVDQNTGSLIARTEYP